MKKFLAMLLALVMALSLVACGEKKDDTQGNGDGDATAAKVKVGFITLHDENSTYDKNFIDAAKEACANLGLVENELKLFARFLGGLGLGAGVLKILEDLCHPGFLLCELTRDDCLL